MPCGDLEGSEAGGALIVFSPNRLFPFETHGVALRGSGRKVPPAVPFIPWVPLRLGRLCFDYWARNYWPWEFASLPTWGSKSRVEVSSGRPSRTSPAASHAGCRCVARYCDAQRSAWKPLRCSRHSAHRSFWLPIGPLTSPDRWTTRVVVRDQFETSSRPVQSPITQPRRRDPRGSRPSPTPFGVCGTTGLRARCDWC